MTKVLMADRGSIPKPPPTTPRPRRASNTKAKSGDIPVCTRRRARPIISGRPVVPAHPGAGDDQRSSHPHRREKIMCTDEGGHVNLVEVKAVRIPSSQRPSLAGNGPPLHSAEASTHRQGRWRTGEATDGRRRGVLERIDDFGAQIMRMLVLVLNIWPKSASIANHPP